VVLTKSFQNIGSTTKALTLAQWIGNRYNNNIHARLIAFLSLLLITFIVLICVGLVKILSSALGASELYVLIGLVVFVFGYTMFGGANSMINTNAIQASVMAVVALILLFSGWEYFQNGWMGFWDKINEIDPLLSKNYNRKSPLFRDFFEVVFCNFIIGIAIVAQPHIITKSLMLRSSKDVNKYLMISIIALMLFFAVLFVGFYARLMMPELINGGEKMTMDSIMSVYVIKRFSPWLAVIVVFGMLSAGLSTLEGLVQSVSTTITNDIILPLSNRDFSENKKKNINKGVILILMVITILVSYDQLVNPNLSVGILAQNGVYLFFSAAFIPILFGIFIKNVPSQAPLLATITAVVIYLSIYYGELTPYYQNVTVKNPAIAGALAVLGSVIVGVIVLFIYRKKDKETYVK
ncbi:MAG TPA: hypothetical protein VK021_05630, partial [Flavobacteriaceae bacterium]|nr:hypothetical protein [Flavobacteriaceae bacterium]